MPGTRYPRIPHLAGSRTEPGDLLWSRARSSAWLGRGVRAFEKLDGINVGFSFERPGALRIHSRVHGVLRPADVGDELWELAGWACRVQARLFGVCGVRLAAFGEFLGFRLGVGYSALPDWVVFFDLVDLRTGRALDDGRRRLRRAGFIVNEPLARRRFRSLAALARLRGARPFGADRDEGLLLERRVGSRAKLVWPDYEALPGRAIGRSRNALHPASWLKTEPCPW